MGLDDKALNLMLVGNHIALGLMNIICIFFCSLLFLLATYLSIWTTINNNNPP